LRQHGNLRLSRQYIREAPVVNAESDPLVLTRTLQIRNRRGLHARAAAKLVGLAEQYSAAVDVKRRDNSGEGEAVSARSIMGLMMLGAGIGSEIDVSASGWDAREALDAISALVEDGFHEQD
jgi:phosphocarrier protein HPr